jgi:di/tricarboxylate transporter
VTTGEPSWPLIWLGIALFAVGLILLLVRMWWVNRRRRGAADTAGVSGFVIFLQALVDLVKQGRIDLATILLGLFLIVVGAVGVDPFRDASPTTPNPNPTASAVP